MRIGQGYDVHRLVEGRKLIIGGVDIPYEKGLLGHSDADVLLHAVMDALLGAAALGDIARAKGMTQLSKETGITRDGLYKALSPTGNPSFDTVQKVIRAFGLKLNVAAVSHGR